MAKAMKSLIKLKDEARQHEQQEEWENALQLYLQVLKTAEEGETEVELPLYNRVGDLYTRLGRPSSAVAYYEQAADRYAEAGLYNNAIALCNKALRYMPERHDLLRKLGQFSASQGFFTDARRWFLEYAERMFRENALDEAFNALTEFANISRDPEVRELLARRLHSHGRTQLAVEELRIARTMRLQAGERELAEQLRQEILQLDPGARLDEPVPAASAEPEWSPLAPGETALDAAALAVESPFAVEEPREEPPTDLPLLDISEEAEEAPDETAGISPVQGFQPTELVSHEPVVPDTAEATPEDESESLVEGMQDLPLLAEQDEGPAVAPLPGFEPTGMVTPSAPPEEFPDLAPEWTDEPAVEERVPTEDAAQTGQTVPAEEAIPIEGAIPAEEAAPVEEVTPVEEATPVEETAPVEPVMQEIPDDWWLKPSGQEPERPGSREVVGVPDESEAVEATPFEEEQGALEGAEPTPVEGVPEAPEPFERAPVEAPPSASEWAAGVPAEVEAETPVAPAGAPPAEPVSPESDRGEPTAVGAGSGEVAPPLGDEEEYVDLAALIASELEPTVAETRFVVEETEPTGDEDQDFADLLSTFKTKVAQNVAVEDVGSHYDLGLAFKEMGLLDEAIGEFQTALKAGDDRLKIYEELGQCFILKEQHSIAAKLLSRVLQARPDDELDLIGIYYLLGQAHEQLGQAAEARDAYERVLGLDMSFRDVTKRLAAL